MNFLDMLNKFLFLIINNYEYVILLILALVINLILIYGQKNKVFKKITNMLLVYLFLILILIAFYSEGILLFFDGILTAIIKIIYYPSLDFYFLMIVISNFFFLKSLYYKKDRKLQYINSTFFTLIMYMFILILNIIKVDKVNVYEREIYKFSNDLRYVMMLSIILFLIWVLIIFIRNLSTVIVETWFRTKKLTK